MDIFGTTNTASSLVASVATAVQTTLGSLTPVIVAIVALVLGFVLAKYLISIFKTLGKAR